MLEDVAASNTDMTDLSFYSLAFLTSTFVVAGLVKGVTGMGLPTVAMGILGTVMPPAAAAAMLLVPSLVTNVWQLLAGPQLGAIIRRLGPMMAAIAVGTIWGSGLLAQLDPSTSSQALGAALMCYAIYALLTPEAVIPARIEPWAGPVVGLLTGLITGATGVFVLPAVPYLQALRLDKDQLVQAMGLSFTTSTIALGAGLTFHEAIQTNQFGLSALAVIPALVGMWLGQKIRGRISPRWFRFCFLIFLLVIGLDLLTRPLR